MAVLHDWQEPVRQQLSGEDAYRIDTIIVPFDGGLQNDSCTAGSAHAGAT